MTDLADRIASLQQAYVSAVDCKNADAFLALYSPAARVFDTWAPWAYESTADRQAGVRAWLGSLDAAERVQVTFEDTQVLKSSDSACATAVVSYAAIDRAGKVLRSMQNRLTWFVTMANGHPLILHEHTSVPIGDDMNPILQRPQR